jgi:hypothetical protein
MTTAAGSDAPTRAVHDAIHEPDPRGQIQMSSSVPLRSEMRGPMRFFDGTVMGS